MTFNNQTIGNSPETSFTAASDDVGGVQFQRVKLVHGDENSTDAVTYDYPLPVSAVDGSGNTIGTWSSPCVITPDNALPVTNGQLGYSGNIVINGQSLTQSNLEQYRAVFVEISGTWSGTLVFEASTDSGTTYTSYPLRIYTQRSRKLASSTTANGRWAENIFNLTNFRVRSTAWTSGSADINLSFGAFEVPQYADEDNPTGEAPVLTNVTASASSTTLLSANTNRRGAIFYNDADKAAYIKLGTTASTTSFSYKVLAGGTVELPRPVPDCRIDCIWDASPTGAMRITEIL